ncbi:MAG: potassium channel family protein [Candidatus Cyclobacteriaceae bacterium M3_2C_046]
MNYFLLSLGILLVAFVVVDIVITTLAPHGGGSFTNFISRYSWKFFLFLSNKHGSTNILNQTGMFLIILILANWIIFLWVGYGLIFCFQEGSVVHATTKIPASPVEKFYFVGYTLSTLGYGNFMGGNPFWQILSSIISFTGLIIITIAITYLVPINSAELAKRKLSIYISTLGSSPQEILLHGWDGESFKRLTFHFNSLMEMILQHAQNHLAYPILHYFHTSNIKESSTVNISNLDEAMTILLYCVPEENRPHSQDYIPLRKSISTYLKTLNSAYISPSEKHPPPPDISKLKEAGVPLIDNKALITENDELIIRRKMLRALLEDDGWSWEEMEEELVGPFSLKEHTSDQKTSEPQ